MVVSRRKRADEALLMALACGLTVEQAARSAGVSARTVHRRLANPAFRERLGHYEADLVQRIAGTLTGAGLGSVKILVELQHDLSAPAAVRRGSARDVLTLGLRYREAATLAPRLAAIEAQLQNPTGNELTGHGGPSGSTSAAPA